MLSTLRASWVSAFQKERPLRIVLPIRQAKANVDGVGIIGIQEEPNVFDRFAGCRISVNCLIAHSAWALFALSVGKVDALKVL